MDAGFDIRVTGADDLARLGRDLRGAANAKELRKEIFKAANRTTKPVKEAIADATSVLPGGVGPWTKSRLKVVTKTRSSGQLAGVRFASSRSNRKARGGKADLRSLNRGRLRHPLFGNREHWYDQPVPAGWIDKVMEGEAADRARVEFLALIDDIRTRIRRGD